jgi:dynein heavy chain
LDSLLTSGNIPDLFDLDELETMLMEVKTDALMDGVSEDAQELHKYLIGRVQSNLHLVLSMSPVGSKFRERCRFHPALINCTTIDWYNDWSEFAMQQVSMSFLERLNISIASVLTAEEQEAEKNKISQVCIALYIFFLFSQML